MTHKGFLAAFQMSMLFVNFCIDGTPQGFRSLLKMTICHVSGWHRYAILSGESPKKKGNLLPLLLQVRPLATVYFTFLAFHCCQMLSKKQLWQWPLTFQKKNTASQRSGQTSQPNLQNEALGEVCFSQIAPAGTPQLLPRRGRDLALLETQGHQVAVLQM